MRSAATVFLWLITTVLLAVTVPVMWAHHHLVDQSGYAALAQRAAADPDLQSAMATELTAQVGRLGPSANAIVVGAIARTYTASSAFPGQFAQANVFAHRWLFTDTVPADVDANGRWVFDLAPMLSDSAFAQTLNAYGVSVPSSVPIPLTDNAPELLRPGSLRELGFWSPWAAWGLVVLTAGAAVLTMLSAPNRGQAVIGFGVSALLVGGSGWAAIEYAQRYLDAALDTTSGNLRTVAEVMVGTAQDSMHEWLNLTLIAGGGLVLVGVLVALLGSLGDRR